MRNVEDKVTDVFIVLSIIAVIILKLTGIIQLSWLWLSAIIWVPCLFGCAAIVIMFIMAVVHNYIEEVKEKNKE